MITGFNTDVDFDGRVFHVQTEDKGRENPTIESLVYSRGEIVAARNTRYEDLNQSADYSEDAVMDRMEKQHQLLIREILNGKFGAEGPKPFGHNIITNRRLDEVVAEFLETRYKPEPIRVEWLDEAQLIAGATTSLTVQVLLDENGKPAGGAHVELMLIGDKDDRRSLFSAPTDRQGQLVAKFDLPDLPEVGGEATLLCVARMGGSVAELRQPVESATASV